MKLGSWSLRRRRLAVLLTLLITGLAVVGAVFVQLGISDEPDELQLGTNAADAAVAVYVQVIAVDPVNYAMQIRLDARRVQPSARDLILTIVAGRRTDQFRIAADRAAPTMTLSVDLDGGSVRNYPLDAYTSQITILCTEDALAAPSQSLPMHLTVWGGLFGYDVRGRTTTVSAAAPTSLRFDVDRTGAVRFFGLAMFGIMTVLALCALTIGALVFLGIRKVEVTLFGALGAIIFALPALRNAIPGTPPLGVRADVLVFFWAEIGAVMGLGMLLFAWAFRGARP